MDQPAAYKECARAAASPNDSNSPVKGTGADVLGVRWHMGSVWPEAVRA